MGRVRTGSAGSLLEEADEEEEGVSEVAAAEETVPDVADVIVHKGRRRRFGEGDASEAVEDECQVVEGFAGVEVLEV